MNKKDPYSELLDMMRDMGSKDNPPGIIIGKVSNPSPDLKIKFMDIEIDKDNILIADHLLKGYEREVEITGKGKVEGKLNFSASSIPVPPNPPTAAITLAGSPVADTITIINSESNISGDIEIKENASIKFTDTLKVGDLLAIMPTMDRQMFIVMCRVVSF